MLSSKNVHSYNPSDNKRKELNIDRYHSDFQKLVKLNETIYFAKLTDIQLYINAKIFEKLAQKIHLDCCPTLIYKNEYNQYEQLSQSFFQ